MSAKVIKSGVWSSGERVCLNSITNGWRLSFKGSCGVYGEGKLLYFIISALVSVKQHVECMLLVRITVHVNRLNPNPNVLVRNLMQIYNFCKMNPDHNKSSLVKLLKKRGYNPGHEFQHHGQRHKPRQPSTCVLLNLKKHPLKKSKNQL